MNDRTRFFGEVHHQKPSPNGRASSSDAPLNQQTVFQPRPQPVPRAAAPQFAYDVLPVSAEDSQTKNPLVASASKLLALLSGLRYLPEHRDVAELFQHLLKEIRQFELTAKNMGVRHEIALAARYVMCSAFDEAVLSTPWGSASDWSLRSLLSTFHNEANGGEKFFLILDRMLQSAGQNLDMLELQYILLSLGFTGKYRLLPNGKEKIEDIRTNVFHVLAKHTGEHERELSPHWQSDVEEQRTLQAYLPWWVSTSVAAALLLCIYLGLKFWLNLSANQVLQQLDRYIGL